jgi:hypothetical protein
MLHIEIAICSSYGIPLTLGIMNSCIETKIKRNKIRKEENERV